MKSELFPSEFVLPDYRGRTIANIPATIAALLGKPDSEALFLPPLYDEYWKPLDGAVKRIVLFVIDGMGWRTLQNLTGSYKALIAEAQVCQPICSTFPSTTATAIPSIWTGVSPARHGILGVRLFLPQYSAMIEMTKLSPAFFHSPGFFELKDFVPAALLPPPCLAETFIEQGIRTYALRDRSLLNSAISQLVMRGISNIQGFSTPADMVLRVKAILEQETTEQLFVYAYWHIIDKLSHTHGPNHDAVKIELDYLFRLIKTELVESVSTNARERTLLIITADHGQIYVPNNKKIFLDDHLKLAQMLLMPPAGEPRSPYLYVRQGFLESALGYIQENFSSSVLAIRTEEIVASGLFGPPEDFGEFWPRLGDIVLTMLSNYTFHDQYERDGAAEFLGTHGGLSSDEMLVPWICFDLPHC